MWMVHKGKRPVKDEHLHIMNARRKSSNFTRTPRQFEWHKNNLIIDEDGTLMRQFTNKHRVYLFSQPGMTVKTSYTQPLKLRERERWESTRLKLTQIRSAN